MDPAMLGSGAAFSEHGFNAGRLVDTGVLFECGALATGLLPHLGGTVGKLSLVVIAHVHEDRILHLSVLLATRHAQYPGRPPPNLIGPRGLEDHLGKLGRLAYGDDFWEELLSRNPAVIEEWEGGRTGERAGYRLTAYRVEHAPDLHCLAFRVDARGVSLGYSGDTTYGDGIRRLARESQHLLCECTTWSAPTFYYHLWRAEVEELMRGAADTRFILTHLTERRAVPGAPLASDGPRLHLGSGGQE